MQGKYLWEPGQQFVEQTNVHNFMRRLGFETREDFLHFSRENPRAFWDEMARELGIEWFHPYQEVFESSKGVEWTRWFVNGKLNIAYNCLDRHIETSSAENAACIWEGEDGQCRTLTFSELHSEVNRLANALTSLGLQPGDRVALYMPMVPEVITLLYACFKSGLIAVPIFSGFGSGAVATRLLDCGAKALFTADGMHRRGRRIPLKEKADEAVETTSIEKVVVYSYMGGHIPWREERDIWWQDLIRGQSNEYASLPLDSEDIALILYTSGTTGKPKGTVHTHAGCLVQMAKEIYLAFDHKPQDRFYWVSDIGWMMGPWMIIGNHHFAGTIFLYDGAPDYPAADRFWRMIEQYGITVFGISPTAIRLLMKKGRDPTSSGHRLASLRLLGSTGEPWDEKSYRWFFEKVGGSRCPIINISGGTEIVGCFLFPLPIQPLKTCTLGSAAPGMAVQVFDEEGRPVVGKKGYLVCTRPAPSMTRGVWNDSQRYLQTYWSRWEGVWYHGDWASVDEDGFWYLHGRADETLNVAGRKIGPAEVEDALMEHPLVSEAAVIGVPDELKGEATVAFIVPKAEARRHEQLLKEVTHQIVRSLGPVFRPRNIYLVSAVPKTQSGKVVRRLIRQAYLGEDMGDLSTVENRSALEAFKDLSP